VCVRVVIFVSFVGLVEDRQDEAESAKEGDQRQPGKRVLKKMFEVHVVFSIAVAARFVAGGFVCLPVCQFCQ